MTTKELCEKAKKQFEKRGHHAVLVCDNDNVTVIDWINAEGSSDYYVRYILSRNKSRGDICVMGDLGEAIYEMWWGDGLAIEELAKRIPEYNADYMFGKIRASTDKYVYDDLLAKKELTKYLNEYIDGNDLDIPEGYDSVEDIVTEAMEDYSTSNGFGTRAWDMISEIDQDCFEWLGDCGRKVAFRTYLWTVGLIMACRQIEEKRGEL